MLSSRVLAALLLLGQTALVTAQDGLATSPRDVAQIQRENASLRETLQKFQAYQAALQKQNAQLQDQLLREQQDAAALEALLEEYRLDANRQLEAAGKHINQVEQRLRQTVAEQSEVKRDLQQAQTLIKQAEEPILRALASDDKSLRQWLHTNMLQLTWPRQTSMQRLTKDLAPKGLPAAERLKHALASKVEDYELLETPLAEAVEIWKALYDIDIIVVSSAIDQDKSLITVKSQGRAFRDVLADALASVDLISDVEQGRLVIEELPLDDLLK